MKIDINKVKKIEIDQDKGQIIIEFKDITCEEEIKEEKLIFFEKILVMSEPRYELLLFPKKDFSEVLPEYDGPITVIDYRTGKRVETQIQTTNSATRRITGLSKLWKYKNRHLRLKEGDIIGIVIGQKNSRNITVDFEYEDYSPETKV